MRCPYCRHADSKVVDSREADDGQLIRRRRSCPECGKRFTTVEEAVLAIVKRSGVTEPFSRSKVVAGVRKACQGRPVDDDALALLAQRVEETIRARGVAEIPSNEVGLAMEARTKLNADGTATRVVSMPCWEFFDAQTDKYKEEVLPSKVTARLSVEAGVSQGWHKYVGDKGDTLAVDRFGASAPGADVFRDYGFTVENVIKKAEKLL